MTAQALPKSRCPRCRVNRRALEDIPESGRWERKRYARYCEPCLIEAGYKQAVLMVDPEGKAYQASWWVLPAPARESRTIACSDCGATMESAYDTDLCTDCLFVRLA